MILELLAHQNFADMRYGLDPGFRFTAARGVYKGILKYLSSRYNCPYVVQPLPVNRFRARLEGNRVTLSWQPTPDPREPTARPVYYKVYIRRGEGAFTKGMQIQDTTCTLSIEPGELFSYAVTACNEGGESFPSEVLAAGKPVESSRKVVVVNNFTRVSSPVWFDSPQYAGFTDHLDSGVPWGKELLLAGTVYEYDRTKPWTDDDNPGFGGSNTDMGGSLVAGNHFDFTASHARALMKAGYAVESSSADAFDGQSDAFALDLICGKQLTTRIGRGAVPHRYSVFPEALQNALRRFASGSGNILLSGSYIATDAWDVVYPGVPKASEQTRNFVKEVLGYQWVTNFGDYSGIVHPFAGSELPTVSYNRAWSPLMYRVENPDGLLPASANTKAIMRYQGTDVTAATFYDAGPWRVAAFGFPLETSPEMDQLIKTVLRNFEGQ